MSGLLLWFQPCYCYSLDFSHVWTPSWAQSMFGLLLGIQPCQDSSLTPSHARTLPWTPAMSGLILDPQPCQDVSLTPRPDSSLYSRPIRTAPQTPSMLGLQPCLDFSLIPSHVWTPPLTSAIFCFLFWTPAMFALLLGIPWVPTILFWTSAMFGHPIGLTQHFGHVYFLCQL